MSRLLRCVCILVFITFVRLTDDTTMQDWLVKSYMYDMMMMVQTMTAHLKQSHREVRRRYLAMQSTALLYNHSTTCNNYRLKSTVSLIKMMMMMTRNM